MSSGELHIDGHHATYELRIPMFEIAHVANPETTLLDHVSFTGATKQSSDCHPDNDTYVCTATYDFPSADPDHVDVECTLYQITVPNHVHLLHAVAKSSSDQVVFDQRVTRATIRLRPLSTIDESLRDIFEGMWRALASPAVLFLIALVIAARTRHEATVLAAMYIIGEWLMRAIAPKIPWPLAPQFVEAAMALTVVYLAIEILVLPNAGNRWAVVLALGLFHGLYFAPFPTHYLAGATLIQIVIIATLAWIALRWLSSAERRFGAAALLALGVAWFVFRLIK